MKGIMFCELLTNKTVAKEKTMTRRAPASLKVINENPDDWQIHQIVNYKSSAAMLGVHFKNKNGKRLSAKPTYKVGEVVYIKEPTFTNVFGDVFYKYGAIFEAVTKDGIDAINHDGPMKFGNKLFMGADKARYYIRITDVKTERIHDISYEDCLKEGIDKLDFSPVYNTKLADGKAIKETISRYRNYLDDGGLLNTPQESFFSLFRFANRVPKSKGIPNLWVFCYSYCLCDKEGNEL